MAQYTVAMKLKSADDWTVIKQPDEGLEYNFETTYEDGATRAQTGEGKFTAMYTVESLGYKATDLTVQEMATILQIVARGRKFLLRYFSPYLGRWTYGWFYVGKGSLVIGRLNEGKERFDSLSFNCVSINPINMQVI